MDTILWFARLALSVLAFVVGWQIFLAILGKGNGLVNDILETLVALLKSLCKKVQGKLSEKEEPKAEKPKESWKVNGKEFDTLEEAMAEADRCLTNHEPLEL